MYIPAPFSEDRPEVLREFIRSQPFATLVSVGDDGLPFATHLPLLLEEGENRGVHGVLVGHLARPNRQAADLAAGREVLAIFHGPHAYVSPSWYGAAPAVPTWNYSAVHAYGTARIVDDPAAVRGVLERTVRMFEPPDSPWRMEDLPETYLRSMQAGVVAFEIELNRVEGKFKLSQNRSADDQIGVRAALEAGDEGSKAVAKQMRLLEAARQAR